MSLIDHNEIGKASHDAVFEDNTDSLFELFIVGAEWAEQKITPLFVEFGEWLMLNYDPKWEANENVWFEMKTGKKLTTKEVFVLWMEERAKLT